MVHKPYITEQLFSLIKAFLLSVSAFSIVFVSLQISLNQRTASDIIDQAINLSGVSITKSVDMSNGEIIFSSGKDSSQVKKKLTYQEKNQVKLAKATGNKIFAT